jgi:hypothetical protein
VAAKPGRTSDLADDNCLTNDTSPVLAAAGRDPRHGAFNPPVCTRGIGVFVRGLVSKTGENSINKTSSPTSSPSLYPSSLPPLTPTLHQHTQQEPNAQMTFSSAGPRFGQAVIGPPGAGKTTYCHGMARFLAARGRAVAVINLDPANDRLPYPVDIDVSELVNLAVCLSP